MNTFYTLIICCFSLASFAQKRGVVTVVKDPLIDSLIKRRIELSKKTTTVTIRKDGPIVSQMGYRVQIFYGSDRREVFNEQQRFKSSYPKINTYITYKEPNYYLRAGDFRTRLEAQRMMNELRPVFATLFVIREKINAPSLEQSNDK
ncbi:Sporulation related domain-containing protein [Pedobacter westerhofensis]|uniref:Sporulation related domain-containing protein n=1 Tax=Pedobacter westerhofensis TaxID=425512 RepID=A0A521EGP0_9SPHI|nr:SPOR domain-containing protein [Pedobacter westerhofensis]SMO83022.1 Sporulation related domain-containing protein [Pedobacter westerhofensis]